MKTIIIDGNNLLHQAGNFLKMETGRRKALSEAVRSRLPANAKVIFFFDGEGDFASGDIIFSGKKTADELMREFIGKFKDPSKLIVVSSDKFISSLAEKCSCMVKNSKEFWNEINSPAKGKDINQNFIYNDLEKPERMSRKEIDEFRKYFS
jgi:predicted RNA-binding protein with PIN domain